MDFNLKFKNGDCVSFNFTLKDGSSVTLHGWIQRITFYDFVDVPDIEIQCCPSHIFVVLHSFEGLELYQPDSVDCYVCQQFN